MTSTIAQSPTERVTGAVALRPGHRRSPFVDGALDAAPSAERFGIDPRATLAWAVDVGRTAPSIGEGRTASLWELLAGVAVESVSAARMLEPHLDALAILREAGTDLSRDRDPWSVATVGADDRSSWAVYAAEGGDRRLEARPTPRGWLLTGVKPWCSLASDVSHALVTAFVDGSRRGLFAVDMRGADVRALKGEWAARGLPHVESGPVEFDGCPAVAVGEPGWYLARAGFARGGMSVAACWWGAAVGIAGALHEAARSDRADQVALVHLGRADAALWAARASLAEAASLIDASDPTVDERLLAARVRAVVVDAATRVLAEADAALGPAPLARDAAHAARVSDLHLYLRQDHGMRDAARLGRMLSESTS